MDICAQRQAKSKVAVAGAGEAGWSLEPRPSAPPPAGQLRSRDPLPLHSPPRATWHAPEPGSSAFVMRVVGCVGSPARSGSVAWSIARPGGGPPPTFVVRSALPPRIPPRAKRPPAHRAQSQLDTPLPNDLRSDTCQRGMPFARRPPNSSEKAAGRGRAGLGGQRSRRGGRWPPGCLSAERRTRTTRARRRDNRRSPRGTTDRTPFADRHYGLRFCSLRTT